MHKLRRYWKNIPDGIRRPIVFVIGMMFIVFAGAIGWLPGPGGIPLFLIGIAILATEFEWAERLKQAVLQRIYAFGKLMRRYPLYSALLIAAAVFIVAFILYKLLFRS